MAGWQAGRLGRTGRQAFEQAGGGAGRLDPPPLPTIYLPAGLHAAAPLTCVNELAPIRQLKEELDCPWAVVGINERNFHS